MSNKFQNIVGKGDKPITDVEKNINNKTLLLFSLLINFLFIISILVYFYTPYLNNIVPNKDLSSSSQKSGLALERDEACDRAENLRWHGLQDANIRPLLISEDIVKNMEYYQKNLELIPTGVDAQGGEVLDSDKDTLMLEFSLAKQKAQPIYEDYLLEKEQCDNLTKEYILDYGNE